ncbi:uncharacterized protein LOC131068127 [Cryptomeria japonica]|uniref:uncharacterized protein LOC131068127 n=1 Tax=Cryptomeria japonica TaxID=3369 RepID=UPI0025AD1FF9|nr:uncharacterized protein LOC131068127 [Cryptomeria japonica]
MANIWVRGFKFSNPTALRNVGFIQRGFAHVRKGDTGEDANMAQKATSIFTRTPKPTSGGLIQMFSTGQAPPGPGIDKGSPGHHNEIPGSKGAGKPGNDKGSPPQHNEKPGSKGTGKAAKDTGSDPKNLHEERETKDN